MFRECLSAFIILVGSESSKGSVTAYKTSGTERTRTRLELGQQPSLERRKIEIIKQLVLWEKQVSLLKERPST